MHYYKFNIADWGLSTSHLSLEEEAIYFRLINFYYDSESPIPLETQPVFRRLRMGSQVETASSILTEFFEETDKGWIHSRCENILKDYRKTAKKNKLNGAKGGRPSKNAASSVSQEKPSGLPSESQNNPNQEPLTTNHKPLTKEIKTLDQSEIDHARWFELFWGSGIRKVNKKKAQSLFNNLLKKQDDGQRFINFIVTDISARLANNQLGFAEMHPTTYLNGERWNDEVIPHAENRPNGHSATNRLSAVERVRAANTANRAARADNRDNLADPSGCIREHAGDSVRGSDAGSLDNALEGSYTVTDQGRAEQDSQS